MAGRYHYYGFTYEPAIPKKVNGGIKAQSKRGEFAKKWWGKRWTQILESFNIGARLSRGRSYARKGRGSIQNPYRWDIPHSGVIVGNTKLVQMFNQ